MERGNLDEQQQISTGFCEGRTNSFFQFSLGALIFCFFLGASVGASTSLAGESTGSSSSRLRLRPGFADAMDW